jgi:small subunit ribosomal protein S21e
MQNDEGKNVDLYIPRKCSWTNRLIAAKDHASVQINFGVADKSSGVWTRENKTFALAGYIRAKGEADAALNVLCKDLM